MAFEVDITEFNGPLDLMLHLIHEHKLDLMNLDVNELCTQYISYINSMQNVHLEIASEYLVELANLIMIKSKNILPIETAELEDDYEEDPQEKLVRRLIEYQKFKEVSQDLSESYEERLLHFTKLPSEYKVNDDDVNTIPRNLDTTDLLRAMEKMYQRIALTNPQARKYETKEVSVDERRIVVRDILASSKKTTFKMYEILTQCHNMQEFVITFVVLLDMASHGEIHFNFINDDEVEVEKGGYVYEGILD